MIIIKKKHDMEHSDEQLWQEPTGIEKWVYSTLLQQRRDLEGSVGATASEGSVVGHHYLLTTAAQPKAPLQGKLVQQLSSTSMLAVQHAF